MRRKEMQALLDERAERITLLETRMETMNQLIDGYRAREQSVIESLAGAAETVKKRTQDAEAQALAIVQDAQARAEETIRSAEERAASTAAAAEAYAAELSNKAEADAEALVSNAREALDQARRQAAEETDAAYQRADTLNRAVDRRAKELADLAGEFLGMVSGAYLDAEQAAREAPVQAVAAPNAAAEEDAQAPVYTGTLPDAGGDPKRVMQNIYLLQQRDLPDTVRTETAACETTAAAETEEELEDLAARPMEGEDDDIPREFDDGEAPVQEWSPEAEPEAEIPDVPRVSDVLRDEPAQTDDDLSLDALLDEIIRAGE